jgi:hypothetical protein
MSAEEKVERRPNLSMLALISFIVSFLFARTFTILNPDVVLISSGIHIHHFWYGLALLAVGGWLGISYKSERIDRLSAILFGAGGGIIGDEAGLLLTLEDYWTELTYTFIIVLVTFASMLILLNKYSRTIRNEFTPFISSNTSLYFGVFLAAVSIALIIQTENVAIIAFSSVLTIAAFIIVLAYFIQWFRTRR